MFFVFGPEELGADNRHNLLDKLDDFNSRNCVKLGEGGGGQELGDQFNSPPKWLPRRDAGRSERVSVRASAPARRQLRRGRPLE